MTWNWKTSLLVAVLAGPVTAGAQTTYYVRTDGGDFTQCTGTADQPYPGSGSGQPCAWNHLFLALPPGGSPRISGGDTVIIGAGSYRMGFGAPGAENCSAQGAYECHMPPLPSGPDLSHPTRLLGAGWDAGCSSPPELWGAERPWYVVNLTDTSNAELACLEITDRSSCIEHHATPAVRCQRDQYPYGDWASIGLFAEDSSNVRLVDLDIHGLASIGIHAGRLTDWTVERVRIAGNGWAGWDGDLWGSSDDANSGDLVFRQVEVAFNGCAEQWSDDTVLPATCWGQSAGGYGDGFAAGASGGHWVFENCRVHHNTSDGIDLLYLDNTAVTEVRRLIAEGNAGNQFKVSGTAEVENSVLVGDCAYFEALSSLVDNCRALGNTLSMELHRGSLATVSNVTITGEGDCLAIVGCRDAGGCDGSESLLMRNVLFTGNTDWFQPWENTCLYWYDDSAFPADPVDFDFNLVWRTKNGTCPGSHSVCGQDPLVVNISLDNFDGHLLSASPAVDAGTATGTPTHDLDGIPRDASPDIGAYEFGGIFGDGFESGDTSEWTVTAVGKCR